MIAGNGLSMKQSNPLARVEKARRALAAAKHFDEVKDVIDQASAVLVYVKQAKLGLEMQNDAAEIKLRAERRAGEMLAGAAIHGGDRKSTCRDGNLKLSEIGINGQQSSRWQRMASLSATAFDLHLDAVRDAGKELTTASVLRLAVAPKDESEEREWTVLALVTQMRRYAERIGLRWPENKMKDFAELLRGLAAEADDGSLLARFQDDDGSG